jgi:alpha-aminoadipate carrier protein LysW
MGVVTEFASRIRVSRIHSKIERRLVMVICPECESDLDVAEEEVGEGEIVSCPECGSDFEVVGIEPLELSPVGGADDDEEEAKEESEDGEY